MFLNLLMTLNSDQIFQFRQNLFGNLRNELGHLKTCQTSLFLVGVTGSGVLLGLISAINNPDYIPYLLLVPLIILLPLWIIFYDKARTISRIVGFLRVQEVLAKENSQIGLIGWESAMRKYWTVRDNFDDMKYDEIFKCARRLQRNRDEKKNYKIRESILNSTYWTIVYVLFLLFNLICLGMSFYFLNIPENAKMLIIKWFVLTLVVIGVEGSTKILRISWWSIKIYGNALWEGGTRNVLETYAEIKKGVRKRPHTKFHTIIWDIFIIILICDIFAFIKIYILNKIASDQFMIVLSSTILHNVTANATTSNPALLALPHFNIISDSIFIIFGSAFIFAASVAFWMLFNLIKGYEGRYSYSSFQLRWEIALRGEEFVKLKYVIPCRISGLFGINSKVMIALIPTTNVGIYTPMLEWEGHADLNKITGWNASIDGGANYVSMTPTTPEEKTIYPLSTTTLPTRIIIRATFVDNTTQIIFDKRVPKGMKNQSIFFLQ